MKAKTFEDLLVWKKAHAYVLEIYRITKDPRSEIFGLSAQMRRAAVSVPANIAKGFKKRTPREKIRVLNISQASLEESRYYLILAEDLDYANTAVFLPKLEEISRMLEAYIHAVETNHKIPRG
jgi:four helix bundle protein